MIEERTLETQRLRLRPLSVDDAADLYLAYQDAEAVRFMPMLPHTRIEETRVELKRMLTEAATYWAMELKAPNRTDDTVDAPPASRVIGFVGYLGNPGVPGMGYMLAPDFWRQGYMSEAATAVLAYGFTAMGLERVELWINDANVASQSLARKLGFARRGQFRMKYGHQPAAHDKVVYGLFRHEWEAFPNLAPAKPRQVYSIQPVLAVPDVVATANYYRDQLEFEIDFFYGDPPNHGGVSICDWTTEGARIQLSKVQNLEVAKAGMNLYIFVGPDIDERYGRYKERGVSIHRRLETYPWGMREFSIQDCNGYILRFGTSV